MTTPERLDVVLVVMPFAPLHAPSLGGGLLQAALARRGISCRILYTNLDFAKLIGSEDYLEILEGRSTATQDLVGEWLFSGDLFGEHALDVDGYVEQVLRGGSPDHASNRGGTIKPDEGCIARILAVRPKISPFLDTCVEKVAALQPRVIGLTSMFQQHVPSLALAKRLRGALPGTFIVMGGSNCEGPMGAETARSFPFLNAVVSGEGDLIFPEIVNRVLGGRTVVRLKGVFASQEYHGSAATEALGEPVGCDDVVAEPVQKMDLLPWPNFDDFFQQLSTAGLNSPGGEPQLMFETARGCWWAQKSQCTFCGLNGTAKAFRSKSPVRALEELEYLVRRYPGRHVAVADNVLDPNYFRSFFPMLCDRALGVELFYEVKSNLKKSDVQLLQRAGVRHIQPGVESLSSAVLKLMRKGVTALQNVQMLKWCLENGVNPIWGILWGFPGERPEEYERMRDLMPLITHLPAPQYMTRVRLDRFSPYFVSPVQFGLRDVSPYPSYSFVYPLPDDAVRNLAYFHRYGVGDDECHGDHIDGVRAEMGKWQKQQPHAGLLYLDKKDSLVIFDLRPSSEKVLCVLDRGVRILYLGCDRIMSVEGLRKTYGDELPRDGDVEAALEDLVDAGLTIRERGRYLSLAVDLEVHKPPVGVIERLKLAMEEQFDQSDSEVARCSARLFTMNKRPKR